MLYTEEEILRQKIVDNEQIVKIAEGLIQQCKDDIEKANNNSLNILAKIRRIKKAAHIEQPS